MALLAKYNHLTRTCWQLPLDFLTAEVSCCEKCLVKRSFSFFFRLANMNEVEKLTALFEVARICYNFLELQIHY